MKIFVIKAKEKASDKIETANTACIICIMYKPLRNCNEHVEVVRSTSARRVFECVWALTLYI